MFLGFAVADYAASNGTVMLWLVSRTSTAEATNTNAVVVNLETDPNAETKIASLLHNRVVVFTGEDHFPLPVSVRTSVYTDLLRVWRECCSELDDSILKAIDAYVDQNPNAKLVRPELSPPDIHNNLDSLDQVQRALTVANNLRKVWTHWLSLEQERSRRTIQPKTGASPWIMPVDLSDPNISEVPAAIFSNRVSEMSEGTNA